ncbi:hypothetical protein MARA_38360 [Mycolicibacterium arabiense]|uniref:DUF3566 domain-containing protein n=1 Tax=Mycolicibacterium arabiense TaxID=1286181 RepID=A0A7I7S0F0_9MYCO|nr:DUF3566 domain-containing protein [Mycolicibacterium arabiense]MCV7371658.1 DUF3566 domain-containing protein [Mycolicibacterium arabiense]BBY50368.1 hypothetical protein MARA_38360 [Mycolicibacterium arabiense]
MTSPNDPGYPRAGDGPRSANGSANGATDGGTAAAPARPGSAGEHGDVPPWQRGTARTRPEQRTPEGQPDAGRAGQASGADARLNRFMSGGSAPAGARDNGPTQGPARDNGPTQGPAREGAVTATRDANPTREIDPAQAAAAAAARGETRPEPPRAEVYKSELPDLSGGAPRSGPRKPLDRPSGDAPHRPAARTAAMNRGQGPVRASMQIRRLDPWSVLKVSLVLSVASFFVWMIAVAFLYLVLGGMGVWSKLNSNVGDLLTSASGAGGELVSSGTIFGGAALIGLVNIVLLTAMATVGAFIYNLTTDLVGGIEVTLADRD